VTGCLACTASCLAQSNNRIPVFSCSTFALDESKADLVARFGAENVTTAPILGGGAEGDYTEGTILFASGSNSRVEILWKDREAKQNPELVRVQGEQSRWRSLEGISLGTDL
jgi:hypothetical protein